MFSHIIIQIFFLLYTKRHKAQMVHFFNINDTYCILDYRWRKFLRIFLLPYKDNTNVYFIFYSSENNVKYTIGADYFELHIIQG